MNTARLIFRIIVCVLCAVFALAFFGIEGSVLIAGEWKLYENSGIMLFQQTIKIAVSGTAGHAALMGAFRPNKNCLKKGVCFFAGSLLAAPFLVHGIGFVFVVLSGLFIVTDLGLWQWIRFRQ